MPQRILEDSPDLLVVDKPSGMPTHGGDPAVPHDVVRRLEAWLSARSEEPHLGVHQRLDVGTSGVLLFVRRRELSPLVQADFEAGAVKKRYVAAIEIAPGSALARSERVELAHRIASDGKRRGVVERGGQECRAACRVLGRAGRRALVELLPETGRTHQLRIQLAHVGAPIVGDSEYGGAPAARLMLHAERLELPSLERVFRAAAPAAFDRFLRGGEDELGDRSEISRKLADAACRRFPLLGATDVLRWVNGSGDQLAGVEVDLYAGHVTLATGTDEANQRSQELAEVLAELGASSVYLKQRARTDLRRVEAESLAPSTPLLGAAPSAPLVVSEAGLGFGVELGDGLATGLFLDQRDNRQRVREVAAGASVLNLFAYTSSFSVAAAAGGARRVVSVDVSRRALRRGRDNFQRNQLDPALHAFIDEDAVAFLERAGRRADVFDLVVLDPPSFASGGKGKLLRIERDYERLARLCVAVIAPGGSLLAVTNHRGTSAAALRRIVLDAASAAGRTAKARVLPAGLDCPDGPDGPLPSKSVWLRLDDDSAHSSRISRDGAGSQG